MIEKLTLENVEAFLASKPSVMVLMDADWNKRKNLLQRFEAFAAGSSDIAFGFLDVTCDDVCDKRIFDYLLMPSNVPAMCYINNGEKKLVIGDQQDIEKELA